MMLADVVFLILSAIVLIGAVMAVGLPNVFYNALSLILCLFGVAGLFIYLNAEFLAVVEVIIYIGAISVAIIFAIMFSRPMVQKYESLSPAKTLRSAVLTALFFYGIFKALTSTHWPEASTQGDYSLKGIGQSLLHANALPFEVISLVLLIAIIGALVISSSTEKT